MPKRLQFTVPSTEDVFINAPDGCVIATTNAPERSGMKLLIALVYDPEVETLLRLKYFNRELHVMEF